jgi:hypothetical protein
MSAPQPAALSVSAACVLENMPKASTPAKGAQQQQQRRSARQAAAAANPGPRVEKKRGQ